MNSIGNLNHVELRRACSQSGETAKLIGKLIESIDSLVEFLYSVRYVVKTGESYLVVYHDNGNYGVSKFITGGVGPTKKIQCGPGVTFREAIQFIERK